MKKILSIFQRDFKIARKDPLALWIFIAPLLCAVIVNIISPGVNDTTVNLAIDKNVGTEYIESVEDFANITIFDTVEEVKNRVLKRDEVIGITLNDGEISLIAQGNESENSLKFSRLINALYNLDILNEDEIQSRLSFYSFGEDIPALKRTLSVALLLLTTIISAMIIALGLVDEKNDKTIRAANVTPISSTVYALSKSIIGILMLLISSVIIILILGITDVNWLQMALMIFSISIISIIVSFVIGLSSSDFIEAAASIKMLMVPLLAGILVYELLNEKWHFTVYWNPFYWADKGITEIINKTSTWTGTLLYTGIIVAICVVVFAICKKNIKKHLN